MATKKRIGQHPGQQKAEQGGIFFGNVLGKLGAGILQAADQIRIIHFTGDANFFLSVVPRHHKDNLVFLDLHLLDLIRFDFRKKGAIVHLFDLISKQSRKEKRIEQKEHQHGDDVIKYKGFFGSLLLLGHMDASLFWSG